MYFCGGFTCQPCHAFQNLLPCVIPGWSSLNGKFVWDLQGRCRSELWSLKFVMDRGDQRQMQRCKWVPVNSDFSLFSVLLFFLTLALLSKIKPIPPTDIWLWFHNVGSYGEAMVFLGWYTSLPPPLFFFTTFDSCNTLLPDSPESSDFSIWARCFRRAGDFSLVLNVPILEFYFPTSFHNGVRSNTVIDSLFYSTHSGSASLGGPWWVHCPFT